MPSRRLGRLGCVVPASPTNTSSEAMSRRQSATEVCTHLNGDARRPSSPPFARTSAFTRSAAAPVAGSTLIVAPRTSLLWKPYPALTKYSTLDHGPKTRPSLGLTSAALPLPELAALSLSTRKLSESERRPAWLRSHGVHVIEFK